MIYFRLFLLLSLFSACASRKENTQPFDLNIGLEVLNEDIAQRGANSNTFIDKAKDYGLADIKAYNINIVDLNNDNYSDLVILPSFYSEPEFYFFNYEKKIFVKQNSLFKNSIKASYLLFYDIDKDGVLDAIAGVLNQKTELSKDPLKIFKGKIEKDGRMAFIESQTFKNSTPNSALGLIDYNLDGNLDFFIGNWFEKKGNNSFPVPDQFFEFKNKQYSNASQLLLDEAKQNLDKTMNINATPTYGVQICDMDQDGFPDILTTSTNSYQNKLWMNRYKFREKIRFFENIGTESGFGGDEDGLINSQGGGRTFGIACADYNNDGIMDVFLGELAHNYDSDGVDKPSILTGRSLKYPPKFYRTQYFRDSIDANWHQADRRGVWFDYNNDGLLDLLVDNSGYPPNTKLILFEQLPDHSFEDISAKAGIDILNPIASVIGDFNHDGKMDILTSRSNIRDESISQRLFLFENTNTLEGRRSIRFYLRGKKSNFHGLNAMVILKVINNGEISIRRQNVSYSYGALSPQNEEGLHFGLNSGDEIVSVTVRWPYAKSLNSTRNLMEKKYIIKNEFKDYLNITLCENGDYLIGRRQCGEK